MKASTSLAALVVAVLLGAASISALHAAYPERPVQVIVVFPAGGTTDLIARVMQPAFSRALGVDVVVRNVGGGGGTIGTAEIARARPDGYTIGLSPIGPTTTQPHLRALPYDTLTDLQPICRVYDSPVVMASKKGSGYDSIADIVRRAKAQPNGVIYGSPAPGSIPHVVMVALEQSAGIQMRHIPFKGTAHGMRALLGGVVHIYGDVANVVPEYDLQPIAVYASERLREFPNVPTVKEAGYDLSYSIWGGLFAPAGVAGGVVQKLSAACREALEEESTVEGLRRQRTPAAYLDAGEFAAFVRSEHEKNGKVLRAAGLKK